jgi:hypothetical protein
MITGRRLAGFFSSPWILFRVVSRSIKVSKGGKTGSPVIFHTSQKSFNLKLCNTIVVFRRCMVFFVSIGGRRLSIDAAEEEKTVFCTPDALIVI